MSGVTAITKEAVESAVHRYWTAFCSKSVEEVGDFYSPWATVFGPSAERAESGRVATMRRAREYMHPQASVTVKLSGIDVQLLSGTVALATYPYSFVARNVARDFCPAADHDVANARVSQVFQFVDGTLSIVHEHISVIWMAAAAGAR
jgi:ketosteroid isomerase-like protein